MIFGAALRRNPKVEASNIAVLIFHVIPACHKSAGVWGRQPPRKILIFGAALRRNPKVEVSCIAVLTLCRPEKRDAQNPRYPANMPAKVERGFSKLRRS